MDGAKELETTVFQVLVDMGARAHSGGHAKLGGGRHFYSNWYPLGSIHHYQSTIARS
jgi:hypothetical protein